MKNQKKPQLPWEMLNLPQLDKTKVNELLQQIEKEFDKVFQENDQLRKALQESFKLNQALEAKLAATNPTTNPANITVTNINNNPAVASPISITTTATTTVPPLSTALTPISNIQPQSQPLPPLLPIAPATEKTKESDKDKEKEKEKEKKEKEKAKEKEKEKEKEKKINVTRSKTKQNGEIVAKKSQMNRIVRRFFHDDSIWDVEHFQIMDSSSGEVEDVLATAGCAGTVSIWSQQNIDPVFVFDGHRGSVNCVKANPYSSANLLASASGDGTVQIFSLPLEKLNSKLRIVPKFGPRSSLSKVNSIPGEIFGGSASKNGNDENFMMLDQSDEDLILNNNRMSLDNNENADAAQKPPTSPPNVDGATNVNENIKKKLKKRRSFLSNSGFAGFQVQNTKEHQSPSNSQHNYAANNDDTEDDLLMNGNGSGTPSDGDADGDDNSDGSSTSSSSSDDDQEEEQDSNASSNSDAVSPKNQKNKNFDAGNQAIVPIIYENNDDDDDELFTQTMFDDNSELISNRSINFSNSQAVLGNHRSPVMTCNWLKENILVSGTMDGKIRLFSINSALSSQIDAVVQGHEGKINQICASHKLDVFASCGKDGTVKVWDSKTFGSGNCLPVSTIKINSDDKAINSVQYSVNDKYLVSGGEDQHLRVWDTRNCKSPVLSVVAGSQINDIAVSPHSQIALALSRYSISIFNMGGEKISDLSNLEYGHTKMITSVCWDSEGQNIYSSSIDKKAIQWLFA